MSPDPAIAEGLANVIPEMLDELEEYITGGNRAAALIKATEVVEQDPECVQALWALLELGLPERRRDGSYRMISRVLIIRRYIVVLLHRNCNNQSAEDYCHEDPREHGCYSKYFLSQLCT